MRRALIVDLVRSPFGRGRAGGALDGIHPVDLYAHVLKELLRRTALDPELVEDVITGCVIQVAEQSGNIGRQAVLAAGFPEKVPAVTLDRKCGSAQQAVDFAAQGVIAGAYDVVIAGGVEMMSLVPMRVNRMGKDNEGPLFHQRYREGLVRQGISAELIAARWSISREEMDKFALEFASPRCGGRGPRRDAKKHRAAGRAPSRRRHAAHRTRRRHPTRHDDREAWLAETCLRGRGDG